MRNVILSAFTSISLTALAIGDAKAVDWGGIIVDSFESVGSDIRDIPEKTEGYSIDSWYYYSIADVASVGAASCLIPGAHIVAIPAEFAYLLREVHNSALGLGHLIYEDINEKDFAIIFSIWAGETMPSQQMMDIVYEFSQEVGENLTEEALKKAWEKYRRKGVTGLAVAPGVAAPGLQETSKVATKVIGKKVGVKEASKISTKVATKAGAKIATKVGAKGISGWIPFIGSGVCAAVNTWIMNGVLDVAEEYYTKKSISRRRLK